MRKVINGRLYDTDTATAIYTDPAAGYSARDFVYWSDTLYKTKKGAWFIHREGGASNRFAQKGRVGGEIIVPLEDIEAREWMENHCTDVDTIRANFNIDEA